MYEKQESYLEWPNQLLPDEWLGGIFRHNVINWCIKRETAQHTTSMSHTTLPAGPPGEVGSLPTETADM